MQSNSVAVKIKLYKLEIYQGNNSEKRSIQLSLLRFLFQIIVSISLRSSEITHYNRKKSPNCLLQRKIPFIQDISEVYPFDN